MTDQTPGPAESEPVETEKTTNDLTLQDDVWVDEDQTPSPVEDLGEPDDNPLGGAQ